MGGCSSEVKLPVLSPLYWYLLSISSFPTLVHPFCLPRNSVNPPTLPSYSTTSKQSAVLPTHPTFHSLSVLLSVPVPNDKVGQNIQICNPAYRDLRPPPPRRSRHHGIHLQHALDTSRLAQQQHASSRQLRTEHPPRHRRGQCLFHHIKYGSACATSSVEPATTEEFRAGIRVELGC